MVIDINVKVGTIETASLVGNVLTVTYSGNLVNQADTSYVVDAWGYNITDKAGNKIEKDASQIFTVTGVDTIAPTATVEQAGNTITYTFSEPVELRNNDGTAATLTADKLAIYKVNGGDYGPTEVAGTDVTAASLDATGKILTITYTGNLVNQTDTSYVVDAWGYHITDAFNNRMLPNISQVFTVKGDSDQYEQDNSYQTATSISTDGTHQTHAISPATDEDWICFSAESGYVYDIATSNLVNDPNNTVPSWGMDTYMELYDMNGTSLITHNDDVVWAVDYSSLITWQCSISGTYFVRIMDYTHTQTNDQGTGGYDVSITSSPAVEITGYNAIVDVSAGTAGNATYAIASDVVAALPGTVTITGTTDTVPVTWSETATPAYDAATAGTCVFTGTIGTLPTGYVDVISPILTVTVNVVVAAVIAAPVNITAFDAIPNVSAGTAGSAIYGNAAAVEAALPTVATANASAVTVPVTAWVDTDSYNSAVAGSYTFTATLGTIPAGFVNTGSFTATVEVVVASAATFTSAEWDNTTQLLTLNLQNVAVDSTFNLTKLTYFVGSNSHLLTEGYIKVTDQNVVESTMGTFLYDINTKKLIINLSETDYIAISNLVGSAISGTTSMSDTISASAGWSADNSIEAAEVTPKTVTSINIQ